MSSQLIRQTEKLLRQLYEKAEEEPLALADALKLVTASTQFIAAKTKIEASDTGSHSMLSALREEMGDVGPRRRRRAPPAENGADQPAEAAHE